MMQLTVNGESHEHNGKATVPALIEELQADAERVAVMVNGNVVRRQRFDSMHLKDGDVVEILTFAGGG